MRPRLGKAGLAAVSAPLIAACVLAAPAAAERDAGRAHLLRPGVDRESPLDQAREESGVRRRPASHFALPAGELRVTSERLAGARQTIRIAADLDRAVPGATLEVRVPRLWLERSESGLPFARVPQGGTLEDGRARLERSGRSLTLALRGARVGDTPAIEVQDVGIPAGTYELPFAWRSADGVTLQSGVARIVFYAPVREDQDRKPLARFQSLRVNATNDSIEESEAFIVTQPGNANRVVIGINNPVSTPGMSAWVSGDGGQTWSKRDLPPTMDPPGPSTSENASLCCDPMLAADDQGNVWYGAIVNVEQNAPGPARVIVNRIAAGTDSFRPVSVGLPTRTPSDVPQDKPMMTIDNSPSSSSYGRLYVAWDEPTSNGGINLVLSQCDTRPGGVADAARCDSPDNWSVPIDVTPGEGSYIFPDVAVGPDGRVYVTWWDFSSTNAIQGDVCNPSSQNCASAGGWGTPQAVAFLDQTGGAPVPFACPIVAQPGGRASPSPQVDVVRTAGAQNDRVYVSWGDLRPGSGSTRCAEDPITGIGTPPLASHLTWDSFAASAPGGALPGGPSASASVGTRLLADGEGGGQANSDDWFPWLSVDQTTGQAVADFYSTRDDASRQTTEFYVRTVTPSGAGHSLGPLTRVSSAPSDYSSNMCCAFGNDYGDYEGLDATQGVAYPVWTDNSSAAGGDGEAFSVAVGLPAPPPPSGGGGGGTGGGGGGAGGGATDTRAPRVKIRFATGASRVLRRRAVVVRLRADEAGTARLAARIVVPGASRTFRLRGATRTLAANRTVTIRLHVSARVRRAIRRALRSRRRVTTTVTASVTDAAGNRRTAKRRLRLRR